MLFQGSYKAKIIDNDIYLKYLNVYIQVKIALNFMIAVLRVR